MRRLLAAAAIVGVFSLASGLPASAGSDYKEKLDRFEGKRTASFKGGAGIERCCYYNGKKIGCSWRASDVERSLYVEWEDGVKETYNLIRKDAFYRKIYEDSRGGVWEYWLGAQGNERLTNLVNGNEIYVPLRGCVS